MRSFDGSYIEGFESPERGIARKDHIAKGIAAFQKAAREGYLIAFTAGLGGEEMDDDDADEETKNPQRTDEIRKPIDSEEAAKHKFNYLLATFLVCAEKHSYFYARDGYDAEKSNVWMKHPPEFARPLGAPKGPAVRKGYVYTRKFAHASVHLDLEAETGKIQWR